MNRRSKTSVESGVFFIFINQWFETSSDIKQIEEVIRSRGYSLKNLFKKKSNNKVQLLIISEYFKDKIKPDRVKKKSTTI